MEIPLHELILKHREEQHDQVQLTAEEGAFQAAGLALGHATLYKAMLAFGRPAMRALALWQGCGERLDDGNRLPVLRDWTQGRNLPLLAKPFHARAVRRPRGGAFRD